MATECPKGRNRKQSDEDMVNLIDNVEQKDDLKYNRRAFLKTAVGASMALGLSTVPFSVRAMIGLAEPDHDRVEIIRLDQLPKGESVTFHYPTENDPALLIHTVEGKLVAYNSACTHLMCPVFYQKEKDVLLCPCHKGYFDVNDGHPVAGPPQRELPLIEIEVDRGVVYAVGRQYRHG
ncbi:Ferredoxin subunit of nitrite reductase or a ring-hydroxylating dioxygenase [Evansella caseinilytica]|uniref:Ferredoxin subunit of nitrite reductase or a ring-hydroxylating dioxygenase n=1 Tax=Evansella caseinilytica TaxID=1503961 RepID=A0A1H3PK95_9BACI|nr:Rieske 2Fe-2S domain-containing protein [Evansella caseinilytica]SDZ01612.1 Ferredoxin subunit of nitrite reductase or a ring-hydroxylating dioxygenase [Evansella caseinilytica]